MHLLSKATLRHALVRRLPQWFLVAATATAATLAAGSARAVTFTVNTSSDSHDSSLADGICKDSSGKCSLRAAIEQNNHSRANATINIGARTINLNTATGWGQLEVNAGATINGAGSASTIIDARGLSRVMRVDAISLLLSDVTLVNGNGCKDLTTCDPDRPGGELYVTSNGWVTTRRSVFTTNPATGTIAANSRPFPGGGVSVAGVLDMTDCTVSGNSTPNAVAGGAQNTGGGLFVFLGGRAQVYYSTFSGNVAQRGGGVATGGGSLKLVNSTVSGNSSTYEGGGGVVIMGTGVSVPSAVADIMYTTIVDNRISNPSTVPSPERRWGAGIRTLNAKLNLGKSIVAWNNDNRASTNADYSPDIGQDAASTIVSYADNFIGITGSHLGNYIAADGFLFDFFGGSMWMDALAFNGGHTKTHFLWGGDPIDSYSGDGGHPRFASPSDDQTHSGRWTDGDGDGSAWTDSGSFEY